MNKKEYGQWRSILWNESDVLILARTIYGEARGESEGAKIAVANVIMNRVKNPKWWGNTVKEVCLAKNQFSCFNFDDPNFLELINVTIKNKVFQECFGIAFSVMKGFIIDNTNGANHYHNKSVNPEWNDRMNMTLEIDNLLFYNEKSIKS